MRSIYITFLRKSSLHTCFVHLTASLPTWNHCCSQWKSTANAVDSCAHRAPIFCLQRSIFCLQRSLSFICSDHFFVFSIFFQRSSFVWSMFFICSDCFLFAAFLFLSSESLVGHRRFVIPAWIKFALERIEHRFTLFGTDIDMIWPGNFLMEFVLMEKSKG